MKEEPASAYTGQALTYQILILYIFLYKKSMGCRKGLFAMKAWALPAARAVFRVERKVHGRSLSREFNRAGFSVPTGETGMELKDLRHFLAIAREKTISGAADSLYLTQPTLSRQMMELEEELGKKLFIRGNRKITLTEEGIFLRNRAEEVLSLVARTEAEFLSSDTRISGEVHIGGAETEAVRSVARIMKKLNEAHPQIRYRVTSSNAEGAMEQLDNGLLDFGIFVDPVDVSKYEFMRLKEKYAFGVLMRKDSPLAASSAVTPEQLTGIPLFCPNREPVEKEFAAWMGAAYAGADILVRYNLAYNVSVMVEEGLGHALCLEKAIRVSEDGPLCFRPLTPRMESGVSVAWKKYQTFSKAAGAFLEFLRKGDGQAS